MKHLLSARLLVVAAESFYFGRGAQCAAGRSCRGGAWRVLLRELLSFETSQQVLGCALFLVSAEIGNQLKGCWSWHGGTGVGSGSSESDLAPMSSCCCGAGVLWLRPEAANPPAVKSWFRCSANGLLREIAPTAIAVVSGCFWLRSKVFIQCRFES